MKCLVCSAESLNTETSTQPVPPLPNPVLIVVVHVVVFPPQLRTSHPKYIPFCLSCAATVPQHSSRRPTRPFARMLYLYNPTELHRLLRVPLARGQLRLGTFGYESMTEVVRDLTK